MRLPIVTATPLDRTRIAGGTCGLSRTITAHPEDWTMAEHSSEAKRPGTSANGVGNSWGIDMYDFSELRPTNKEIATLILIVTVVLVAVFSIGYMLGLRNSGRADQGNNSGGTGQVGQHLQSAVTGQREITQRIDRQQDSAAQISGRIESGAAGIEKAAAATGRAESIVRESGVLIAEGQRIISTIRSRGKTGAVKN